MVYISIMALLKRSNLRQLILVLALLSTLATVLNMYFTSSKVQRQALITNTLKSHEAYASKLADSAQLYLESVLTDLAYSADVIARNWNNPESIKQEIFRINKHGQVFNSVVLLNADGLVIDTSNNTLELVGTTASTEGIEASLRTKQPHISMPYESTLNNLIIMISYPIYTEQGVYLGFVAGTIYLKEENILSRLLGEHYYQDDSYLYVIGEQGKLLYHPNKAILGTIFNTSNSLLSKAITGKSGHAEITNEQGVEMLSGYAYIPATRWGIISQRPLDSTLAAHDGIMNQVLFISLPITLLMLGLIWFLSCLISSPLRQLAANAKNMRSYSTINQVQGIKAWYFEANQLKDAFLMGMQSIHEQVGQLRQDVRTDPLTGLQNRRTLEYALQTHKIKRLPFTVISVDIDHFKRVNDTYGHDVGDTVLKELAQIMLANSRENDYCIRVGGEEFVIILPGCPLETTVEIADRFRTAVAKHDFPTVGALTISLGVAAWPAHDEDPSTVLKLADTMLYAAKQNGRNQVRVASTPLSPAP